MAKTVNDAFKFFIENHVNLLPERVEVAKISRDWLLGQLDKLETKDYLNFPKKYSDKHIKFGSFARRTKIRELDDIDIMFCLTADNATYTKNGAKYIISTENSGDLLKEVSDNGILNSRKVVNKFKNSLSQIEHYKKAELHSRGEAATLSLISYEWNFDIVPCFFTSSDYYLIPDGNGDWKATDPRIDKKRVTEINQKHSGNVLTLIRILKYWNRYNSSYTISSYLFENLVLNFSNNSLKLSQYIDINIREFFEYLGHEIFNPVNDPKGIQGDLNSFTYIEKQAISTKANLAYEKAKLAIYEEINNKNQEKAIKTWRELFGDSFPKYE